MPRKKNSQYITKNHLIARYKAGAKRQYVNDITFCISGVVNQRGSGHLKGSSGLNILIRMEIQYDRQIGDWQERLQRNR